MNSNDTERLIAEAEDAMNGERIGKKIAVTDEGENVIAVVIPTRLEDVPPAAPGDSD